MKHQNVFWGTLLITFGLLFLFDRFGILNLEWFMVWRLWPILLILWGVSILPLRGLYKLILAIAVAALSILVYTNMDPVESPFQHKFRFNFDDSDTTKYENISQEFSHPADSVVTATLNLEAGAGNFTLNGTTGELIYVSKSSGNVVYNFTVEKHEGNAKIILDQDSEGILNGKNTNNLNIMLNDKPLWAFDIEIGAANLDFDLSQFKVNKIEMDGGAASMTLKLGSLNPETDVVVNAAASSIEIIIPENAGCSIEGSSVLSHRDTEGFVQIDKGHYETSNFATASQKIKIKVDAAVSSFEITRY